MTIGGALRQVSLGIGQTLHRLRWAPRMRSTHDLRVVVYHGIGLQQSVCQRFLNDEVPLEVFERHLDFLQARYEIVPLEEGIERVKSGRPARPLACITFDDGLQSVKTDAFPVLKRRGVPASVFLNTAVMDNKALLWQHHVSALASILGAPVILDVLNLNCRHDELIPCCQENFHKIPLSRLANLTPDAPSIAAREQPYLTWDDVDMMCDSGLIRFYSHTARHFPLAALPAGEMQREIDEAFNELKVRRGARTELVSFPFGMDRDFGHGLAYALRRHPYAVTVRDGWNPVRRLTRSRTVSRVCLDHDTHPASLYATLEIQPLLKGSLNTLLGRC